MLVTRDAALAKRAQVMRLHGIDRDAFDRYTTAKPAWAYDVIAPGFKYNMTDIAASLGIHQLAKAERFHARRSEIAHRYNHELKDLPLRLPPVARAGDVHAWHLYVICLTDHNALSRDEAIQRLFDEGIGVSVHYIPLHMQTYWRERYKLLPERFPVSTADWQQMISLPIYTKMTDHDQTRVIEALHKVFAK
jgi:dTDP-4-amino-4,6-dideoxygalactose transaminase